MAALLLPILGCETRGPEIWVTPLAEMKAELRLGGYGQYGSEDSNALSLYQPGVRGYCSVLSPRDTIVTFNGQRARFNPGGASYDETCISPSFWTEEDPRGKQTIEIDDTTAHWTFVVWNPFDSVAASVISHTEQVPAKIGDTVEIELTQATAPFSNVTVDMGSINRGTVLTQQTGLRVNGNIISFELPMLITETETGTPIKTVSMFVEGNRTIPFERCDAPLGCVSQGEFLALVVLPVALSEPPPEPSP